MLKPLWVYLNIFIVTLVIIFSLGLGLFWIRPLFVEKPEVVPADTYENNLVTPVPTLKVNASSVLLAISNYRQSVGLSVLNENVSLCEIADHRAIEVGNRDGASLSLSHAGLERYTHFYKGRYFAENLMSPDALSDYSGSSVVAVWLGSPSHKELLDKKLFTEGCVASNNNVVVLIMGQPY